MKAKFIAKGLVAIFLLATMLFGKDYTVDTAHSNIEFKVKHLAVSNVKGSFKQFSGQFAIENNKVTSFTGEVNTNSIDTNNKTRDNHIKDSEFFDVKKFPKATIKLVSINGNSGIFELTIKNITKQVKFNVEILGTGKNQANKEIIGIELSGNINRKDFGIGKSTLNTVISDDVYIVIDIEGFTK